MSLARSQQAMDRVRAAGLVLTIAGLGAYLLGVIVAYEGRAFSVTVIMVGTTLVAIGGTG